MPLVDRALSLNPSFGRGWYIRGILKLRAGQADAAIEDVETALRLNPRDRFGAHANILAAADFVSRRFEEASAKLLLAVQENPGYPGSYRFLAASYAHMGRLDEAREIVERLKAITPHVVSMSVFFQNPEHRELFLSGLRLATGETA